MQFVKAYWVLLASGVLTVAGIVLAVLGMTSDAVVQAMKTRMQTAAEINTLRGSAQNADTINAERELGQKFDQEYEAVVRMAESINERRPLMDGVFPKPAQMELPYRFRDAYKDQIRELPSRLKAGWLPTPQEIVDEAEFLADLARRDKEAEGDQPQSVRPSERLGGNTRMMPTPPAAPPPSGGGGKSARTAGGRTPGGRVPGAAGQPARGAAQEAQEMPSLPTGVQSEEARQRAVIKKARSIRIYASPESSFHVSPIVQSHEPPSPADMWYAQVSLWVQQDLVEAIARVNEEAVQQAGGKEVGVTGMPVKRIESIQVLGYVTSNGMLLPFPTTSTGVRSSAAPAVAAPESFTGRRSDSQFDVIRLTLTVIVDQRQVLKLIDSITRTNFYQLVSAEYKLVDGMDPAGYLYGDGPVVQAVLDFEGYLARKVYKEMMPEEVLVALGAAKGSEPAQPQQTSGGRMPRRY